MAKCAFCGKNEAVEGSDFCSRECEFAYNQKQALINTGTCTEEELKNITDPEELPLTEAQKDFVYEYIRTKNLVKAFTNAFPKKARGLTNRQIHRKASFMLTLPYIRRYANEVIEEFKNRFFEDKFGVLVTLDTIINTPITAFLNEDGTLKAISEIDDQSAICIKKFTRQYNEDGSLKSETIELEDKIKAINAMGKYYQLFTERKEVDVKVTHLLDVIKEENDVDVDSLIKKTKEKVEQKVNQRFLEFQKENEKEQVIDTEVVKDGEKES
jgi:hypothetical protein